MTLLVELSSTGGLALCGGTGGGGGEWDESMAGCGLWRRAGSEEIRVSRSEKREVSGGMLVRLEGVSGMREKSVVVDPPGVDGEYILGVVDW